MNRLHKATLLASAPRAAMSVLWHLSVLRLLSLLCLVTNRFWKKLPVVTLNLHLYETPQEEKSSPIISYLIPYKNLPFDIVELMEEMVKERIFTKYI